MRNLIGTLLFGLLSVSAARGQTFERGYLVTNAGDTLRGEIENRFWQAPPEEVVFRAQPTDPGLRYRRAQVRAFRMEGGRYFRAEVLPLDRGAQTQVANLPQRLVVNQQPDSLLAEVLVDGSVPLLRAVVAGVTHYFVRRPGQPYLELSERKYLTAVEGRQRIVDANNYQSQLTVYFGDCPAAVKAAEASPYSAKGLAAVVQAFSSQCAPNKQIGTDYTTLARPQQPFAYNWGALLGAGYNRLAISRTTRVGEEAPLLDGLDLDGRFHPVGGLYLDVLLPGRRWAGHGELAFSTYGRRGTMALAGGMGSYMWSGTKLDARLGTRYMFKQQPTREYFVGGGFNFNSTTSSVSEEKFGSGSVRLSSRNVRVPTQAAFFGPPPFDAGVYVEAGVRRKRLTASVDAGFGGSVGYTDPLAVLVSFPAAVGAETDNYFGYRYTGTLFSARLVLAYRLNPTNN